MAESDPTASVDEQTKSIQHATQTWQGDASAVAPNGLVVPGYVIEAVLGQGGMGIVYKARDLELGRTVAIKTVIGEGNAVARFKAEAQAVARLQHQHIVQIFEIGETGGRPYCVLEFVAGGSLAERLKDGPVPPRRAAELVETLARAVQAAHARGIVHRDLKPANVLLTDARPGTGLATAAKVADFGLAKLLDEDSGRTRDGSILGTPSYMAPEQAGGETERIGPAADIYALGAVLYECLTGKPPFKGATVFDTLEQVRTREPAAPRALVPSVPRDLEMIALKCLRKDPAARYASADGLADDLRRVLDGEPIHARPVGTVERAYKWVRRNPLPAALVALLFAVLITGTGVALALAREAGRRAEDAENSAQDARDSKTTAEQKQTDAIRSAAEARTAKTRAEEREKEAQRLAGELETEKQQVAAARDAAEMVLVERLLAPLARRELAWEKADAATLWDVGALKNDRVRARVCEEWVLAARHSEELAPRSAVVLHAAVGIDPERRALAAHRLLPLARAESAKGWRGPTAFAFHQLAADDPELLLLLIDRALAEPADARGTALLAGFGSLASRLAELPGPEADRRIPVVADSIAAALGGSNVSNRAAAGRVLTKLVARTSEADARRITTRLVAPPTAAPVATDALLAALGRLPAAEASAAVRPLVLKLIGSVNELPAGAEEGSRAMRLRSLRDAVPLCERLVPADAEPVAKAVTSVLEKEQYRGHLSGAPELVESVGAHLLPRVPEAARHALVEAGARALLPGPDGFTNRAAASDVYDKALGAILAGAPPVLAQKLIEDSLRWLGAPKSSGAPRYRFEALRAQLKAASPEALKAVARPVAVAALTRLKAPPDGADPFGPLELLKLAAAGLDEKDATELALAMLELPDDCPWQYTEAYARLSARAAPAQVRDSDLRVATAHAKRGTTGYGLAVLGHLARRLSPTDARRVVSDALESGIDKDKNWTAVWVLAPLVEFITPDDAEKVFRRGVARIDQLPVGPGAAELRTVLHYLAALFPRVPDTQKRDSATAAWPMVRGRALIRPVAPVALGIIVSWKPHLPEGELTEFAEQVVKQMIDDVDKKRGPKPTDVVEDFAAVVKLLPADRAASHAKAFYPKAVDALLPHGFRYQPTTFPEFRNPNLKFPPEFLLAVAMRIQELFLRATEPQERNALGGFYADVAKRLEIPQLVELLRSPTGYVSLGPTLNFLGQKAGHPFDSASDFVAWSKTQPNINLRALPVR